MDRTQRFTLVATGLGLFMIFLDALIVNVALPDIQREFNVGEAGLQWVVTAYSLGMAVFIMSAATLADLQGRRRWYFAGITVFTLASIACGLAPTLEFLNVARAVQGVAAATANVTSLALVSAAFPDARQRARAIGIWTAIASVGAAIGPTLGGVLVQTLGWRSIFLVNVPVGLLVLWFTLRHVAESRDAHPRTFDIVGQILFMVTVGSLAEAVIEGPKHGWGSPLIVGLFAVAAVGLCLFIWSERRSADPMMDLTLFRDRAYSLAIATICVVFFSIYGMLLLTTQFLQNVRGYPPEVTGLMILPFSGMVTVVSPFIGRLVGKFGARRLILMGLVVLMAGLFGLILGGSGSPVVVLVALSLCGIGGALCLTPITTLAMTSVPPDRAGMASGIMSAQRAIGSTVGFAVLGSVLAAWLLATLDPDLATVVPDPVERRAIAQAIVASANPRAHVAEIGPRQPILHANPAMQAGILAVAERDFVQGIRIALLVAIALLAAAFLAGWKWYPRGGDAMLSDAEREAARLASS
ncbi:MAG: MFS transporter, partial [Casimicrobiaceae bacterium]